MAISLPSATSVIFLPPTNITHVTFPCLVNDQPSSILIIFPTVFSDFVLCADNQVSQSQQGFPIDAEKQEFKKS